METQRQESMNNYFRNQNQKRWNTNLTKVNVCEGWHNHNEDHYHYTLPNVDCYESEW